MLDALVTELSERYGLESRGRELFGLLVGYIYNERRGGFSGFVESFHLQGYGDVVGSWTAPAAAPRTINASEVGNVFGQGLLNDWGSRLGASRATIAAAIAGVLPRLVAALAPDATATAAARFAAGSATSAPELGTEYRGSVDPGLPTRAPSGDFSVIPGVDGLVDRNEFRDPPPPASDRFAGLGAERTDPIAPARPSAVESPRDVFAAPPSREGLRREPVSEPLRSLDPGERRVAEMAAAMSTTDTPRFAATADDRIATRAKPENWRPAVHPPRKSSWAWLVWLLLLLALLAAGLGYAWTRGLLDPYIDQYGLPLQRSAPASQ